MHGESKVVSVELRPNGELWVVRRQPSNATYCSGDPVPDGIYRERYRAEGERIVLDSKEFGRHVPAKRIPERFEFGDSE